MRGNIDARGGNVPGKHLLLVLLHCACANQDAIGGDGEQMQSDGEQLWQSRLEKTRRKGEKKLFLLSVPRKYSGAKSQLSDLIGSAAHPSVTLRRVQEGSWVKFLCKSEMQL